MNGIFLSSASIGALSPSARREVLQAVGLSEGVAVASVDDPVEFDGPAELSVGMARQLIAEPISDKSVAILRTIALSATPQFHQKDAINSIQGAETYLDIKNVWSGITRRTRSILDDKTAKLVHWDYEGIYEGEEYVDHIGRVAPITHRSLRAAFGIDV
ncbi:hypothetical protein GCM10010923_03620 [Blastomonas marina]|uniref:Uncharacterized protein n=1 Tax=Blastomonas marina TaxID=1867408 RepID=A0ABQ1F3L1_9SPHN|nr:hypothetical protein [Blastomonas marina]GFZ98682.1 hypothetical protein GCM10010923_03620 [Blastomonas marina]